MINTAERTSPTVSVIIPTLNEAENLPHVLPRIPAWVHEVLLIDGLSTDGTVEVARRVRPNIRILKENRQGKGAALRSGYLASTGDIIIALDADGSTDPREIPAFVGALVAGADYAKGTRFIQGAGTSDMPLYRKIGNAGLVLIANILFGAKFSDITFGYNAIWRHHINSLALEIDGWPNEIISNIRVNRARLKVVEVACFEHERIYGDAKLRAWSAGWQILKAMLRERFTNDRTPGQELYGHLTTSKHTFVCLLQTLYSEIYHINRSHQTQRLSTEKYHQALQNADLAYQSALSVEFPDPYDRTLQLYFREYCPDSFTGLVAAQMGM